MPHQSTHSLTFHSLPVNSVFVSKTLQNNNQIKTSLFHIRVLILFILHCFRMCLQWFVTTNLPSSFWNRNFKYSPFRDRVFRVSRLIVYAVLALFIDNFIGSLVCYDINLSLVAKTLEYTVAEIVQVIHRFIESCLER
jgi:hypothetical protein